MQDFPILSRMVKTLPVPLDADEFHERAERLAQTCQDITAEEARASDVKAQLKARMTQLEGARSELAIIIARKEEMRPIEILMLADFDNGKALEVRSDTMRVLASRPLTDKERQSHLPLNEDTPPEPPAEPELPIGPEETPAPTPAQALEALQEAIKINQHDLEAQLAVKASGDEPIAERKPEVF